jgi:hypothetical protein
MDSRKHRLRIFGTEVDTIHEIRVQQVFRNLLRKIRVTYENIPFLDTIVEPFAEKCRDICPASGIDYHGRFTLIEFLFEGIKGMRKNTVERVTKNTTEIYEAFHQDIRFQDINHTSDHDRIRNRTNKKCMVTINKLSLLLTSDYD